MSRSTSIEATAVNDFYSAREAEYDQLFFVIEQSFIFIAPWQKSVIEKWWDGTPL